MAIDQDLPYGTLPVKVRCNAKMDGWMDGWMDDADVSPHPTQPTPHHVTTY
jgi:hypothetical protein